MGFVMEVSFCQLCPLSSPSKGLPWREREIPLFSCVFLEHIVVNECAFVWAYPASSVGSESVQVRYCFCEYRRVFCMVLLVLWFFSFLPCWPLWLLCCCVRSALPAMFPHHTLSSYYSVLFSLSPSIYLCMRVCMCSLTHNCCISSSHPDNELHFLRLNTPSHICSCLVCLVTFQLCLTPSFFPLFQFSPILPMSLGGGQTHHWQARAQVTEGARVLGQVSQRQESDG